MMLLPLTARLQANHDNESWTWEVNNHRLALVLSLWIGQNTQRRLESEDKRGAYECVCVLERRGSGVQVCLGEVCATRKWHDIECASDQRESPEREPADGW